MAQRNEVTSERFVQGLSYPQFLAQAKSNRDGFEQNHHEFRLHEADRSFFVAFNGKYGPLKVLAIGEDWCPDVVRGLPVMAIIAEETGMELRVFLRDQNPDLMDLYLKEGKFRSIPVFAFFDRNFKPIGHWIERPAIADRQMAELRQELEQTAGSEESRRTELRKRMGERRSLYQHETVRELGELLSRGLG